MSRKKKFEGVRAGVKKTGLKEKPKDEEAYKKYEEIKK
jgi:hypothetical protein